MSIAVELPSLGESVFEGTVARWLVSEGEMVEVDTSSAKTRQRYAALAEERRAHFDSNMRKKGLDWIEARTDQPYLPALRKLFARRASRH